MQINKLSHELLRRRGKAGAGNLLGFSYFLLLLFCRDSILYYLIFSVTIIVLSGVILKAETLELPATMFFSFPGVLSR